MKIKIVYGIDMRLWRYNLTTDKPQSSAYDDLLTYVCKTFGFTDRAQFRISYIDDDETQTTVCDSEDFSDAYALAQKADKKSLKLYIADTAEAHHPINAQMDEKANEVPIQSTIVNENAQQPPNAPPTEEQIDAFLSDAFVMDLLSDLFISVFEALEASKFEIPLMECIQAVLLSSNDKYAQLTSNPVWPYFMNTLLPQYGPRIEQFAIPMIQMNGGTINSQMMKQWIPTIMNMMKCHSQNVGQCGYKGKCGRKRGGWHHRGRNHKRGWRGFHGGRRGHRGHRGRRGFHGRTAHGGNWAGFPFGCGQNGFHQPAPPQYQYVPSAPHEEQIEQEAFEYTEELVAIMNMGFTNMGKIKTLLSEHQGNKQLVVQELVMSK
eukprot:500506_1